MTVEGKDTGRAYRGAAEAERLGPHTVQLRAGGGKYPYGSPLLVTGTERTAMLDSCLEAVPEDADLLLISHYHEDHTVGLGSFRGEVRVHERDLDAVRAEDAFAEAMGMSEDAVASVRRDFAWSPVPHAQGFADGDVFDLGGGVRITAVHLPGHTPGHCGFLVEPDGVLFLGDVDLSSFGPLYSDEESGIADFRAALARCAQIEAQVFTGAHHKGPYRDREEYLAALEAFSRVLDAREQAVLDLVRAGAATPEEMVGKGVVYRPGKRPSFADGVELRTCEKHLADLAERGVVRGPDAEGRYTLA
ncbi:MULTISPECIES: MBL fold metallo-hydrolase [Brevibacterium]|uniref:MBL fold metallo-hydrolase n=1 Tax=Brevibacterium salitolerans TaxID=1403566 RepID=A0ABN2WPI9_9MICO|nr:MBL fold metallo-hydrolase [Brevibacterium sp.]